MSIHDSKEIILNLTRIRTVWTYLSP